MYYIRFMTTTRKLEAILDRYYRLGRALRDRCVAQIWVADQRMAGEQAAFHLAHNWGNEGARALLERYCTVSGALLNRQSRELRLARVVRS